MERKSVEPLVAATAAVTTFGAVLAEDLAGPEGLGPMRIVGTVIG